MRLADLLVQTLIKDYDVKVVFTVTGGGAMYLNDAFGAQGSDLQYIALHHEQSAGMAAESYAALTQGIGVCQVTTGPGGTNALTACKGAWVDSRPVIFISGQVESVSISGSGTRQTGVQEAKIVQLVRSITKAAVLLSDPYSILYELDRLIYLAQTGRKGPVWLDIPLDIQNFSLESPEDLRRFKPTADNHRASRLLDLKVKKLRRLLQISERPLLCIGNGARAASDKLIKFAEHCGIPIVLGWNAKDLYPEMHPLVQGSIGQFGNRNANLLTSKADIVIGVGFRFSIPQIGYDPSAFATNATIVSVDIDAYELSKYGGFVDLVINADASEFMDSLMNQMGAGFTTLRSNFKKWLSISDELKGLRLDGQLRNKELVDSFDFTDRISELIPVPSCIVTDMGTSFTCTHQRLAVKPGVRLYTSSGLAAMGFGLPGAIGAHFTVTNSGWVTLITGDGGLMFNIQELQSLITHKIPLKIIIYENKGYLTMRHMQLGRFNRLVGSGPSSKLDCPDFSKIAEAFGISYLNIYKHDEIETGINWLYSDITLPSILIVHLDQDQSLTPRVQTTTSSDGKLSPGLLESMYPPLPLEQETLVQNLLS